METNKRKIKLKHMKKYYIMSCGVIPLIGNCWGYIEHDVENNEFFIVVKDDNGQFREKFKTELVTTEILETLKEFDPK